MALLYGHQMVQGCSGWMYLLEGFYQFRGSSCFVTCFPSPADKHKTRLNTPKENQKHTSSS